MKKFYLLSIVLIFFGMSVYSQLSAIFVNDNSLDEQSTETVFQIIEQYLGTLAYFDAVENHRSPNYEELVPYKLVIWYSGVDEDDLYFWNDGFEDNPYLEEYIDNGGSLWTIGRGFLNARYIKPPRNFNQGTFLYDYIGISEWSAESYTSDNGMGVPNLIIAQNSRVNTLSLNILEWEDPPEPLIDGCKLVEGCSEEYIFAPSTYLLYGQPAAFYFPISGSSQNITFTFDPVAMDSKGNASTLLSDVLRFYEDVLSDVDDLTGIDNSLTIYPNPSSEILIVELLCSGETVIKLTNLIGTTVAKKLISTRTPERKSVQFGVEGLPSGYYFIQVECAGQVRTSKVVISK